jgi:hypothetical protein
MLGALQAAPVLKSGTNKGGMHGHSATLSFHHIPPTAMAERAIRQSQWRED